MGNLLWFWLMLFCHSPCTELPTYRGLSRMLLKLPVSIALDLGTPSALQPTQSLTTFWGRLSRSEFSPNLWCCGRWTCWMVTSRLVSGGKQESGATVGVNWRCSGEPSGLGGDGGTGGRRLWLPRARIRAGCQELGSGPGQRRQEWAQAPHRFCWDIHSGLSSPFWACNWIKDRFFCAEQFKRWLLRRWLSARWAAVQDSINRLTAHSPEAKYLFWQQHFKVDISWIQYHL